MALRRGQTIDASAEGTIQVRGLVKNFGSLQVLKQIDGVRKAWNDYKKREGKLADTPKRPLGPYRKARWKAMRGRIDLSQLIRQIEFTEAVKRRLIDQIKERGGDPEALIAIVLEELQRTFGADPGRMPLQAIFYSARKPG